MNHRLEVNNLGKRFDNYWVFQKFNYMFESGKIYALTGPSGGGKTTLLNCIGRLLDTSEGTILLDDEDVLSIKILKYYRNHIGYLFQNYALVDEETIFQNLNIVKKHHKRELLAVLRQYNLSADYLDRSVFTLSGGEAQRVALARLNLQNPTIILADEPTGALDHKNRDLVLQSLRKFADEGKIVIVATHDDTVMSFADEKVDISDYR